MSLLVNNSSNLSHIYYNLYLYNNTTSYDANGNTVATSLAIPSYFYQSRLNPYLNTPSDYNATITYFHLDSNSLPVQIVQPKLGKSYTVLPTSPAGYNLEGFETVYEIRLEFTRPNPPSHFSITEVLTYPIYWKPADSNIELPPQPITKSQINKEYFWNYSYQYFLDIVNTTLNYMMDTITHGHQYRQHFPFYQYNPADGKIKFNAPLAFQTTLDGSPVASPRNLKIFLNEALYELLGSFPSLYDGNYYQLLIYPDADNTNVIPIYTKLNLNPNQRENYISMCQEYTTTQLWNPAISIVFTTTRLNVVNEIIANPYITGPTPKILNSNADTLNILYEYNLARRNEITINNFTRAEYRLANLFGIEPTRDLQLSIFWKDEYGDLHPFLLEYGSGVNIKIMFRNKNFV